jgi:hypothetical protein
MCSFLTSQPERSFTMFPFMRNASLALALLISAIAPLRAQNGTAFIDEPAYYPPAYYPPAYQPPRFSGDYGQSLGGGGGMYLSEEQSRRWGATRVGTMPPLPIRGGSPYEMMPQMEEFEPQLPWQPSYGQPMYPPPPWGQQPQPWPLPQYNPPTPYPYPGFDPRMPFGPIQPIPPLPNYGPRGPGGPPSWMPPQPISPSNPLQMQQLPPAFPRGY